MVQPELFLHTGRSPAETPQPRTSHPSGYSALFHAHRRPSEHIACPPHAPHPSGRAAGPPRMPRALRHASLAFTHSMKPFAVECAIASSSARINSSSAWFARRVREQRRMPYIKCVGDGVICPSRWRKKTTTGYFTCGYVSGYVNLRLNLADEAGRTAWLVCFFLRGSLCPAFRGPFTQWGIRSLNPSVPC